MSQMHPAVAPARAARNRWRRVTASAARADTTCPPCPRGRTDHPTIAMRRRRSTGQRRPGRARRPGRRRRRTCRRPAGTDSGGGALPAAPARVRRPGRAPGRRAPAPAAGAPGGPGRAPHAAARQPQPGDVAAPGAGPAGAADPAAPRRRGRHRSAWPAGRAASTPTATARTAGTPSRASATTWSRSSARSPRSATAGLRHHRNEDAFAVSRHRPARRLPGRRRDRLRRRVLGDPPRRGLRRRAPSAANEALLAALPRGTHPQQAMHEAIVAAAAAVNSLAAETRPGHGARPAPPSERPGLHHRRRRRRPAVCWSSAGSATAAPTGCPTTAAARPPGSPRTTRGRRRWSRRA